MARAAAHRRRRRSARGDGTTIQPHFAPLGGGQDGGVVIFLEDASLIAERVQQAKLAALGRLSASIAHEIRNPIGAMSHAGQLLAESPTHRRRRQPAHRHHPPERAARKPNRRERARAVAARQERRSGYSSRRGSKIRERVHETLELYEGAISVVDSERGRGSRMDPTHLHQMVWNLCDNAVKYASETAGAIAVELRCGYLETSGRPYLEVADRGPGIDAAERGEDLRAVFHGQPGGTGLGLYISRELAERNGATLRYLAAARRRQHVSHGVRRSAPLACLSERTL